MEPKHGQRDILIDDAGCGGGGNASAAAASDRHANTRTCTSTPASSAKKIDGVSLEVRQRIAKVLGHLASNSSSSPASSGGHDHHSRPEDQLPSSCTGCIHANNCSAVDIEDIGSACPGNRNDGSNTRGDDGGGGGGGGGDGVSAGSTGTNSKHHHRNHHSVGRKCCASGSHQPADSPSSARRHAHSGDHGDDDETWLFDPRRFEGTQKPLLEASTLPRECYSSQKWFHRELERVFMPSWTLLGREDEMVEPGSYLADDTEWGGPVAACRGEDGHIYAFANVCCHRGAKVLQGSLGKASAVGLVCPYHAWTYDFDGKLLWAPGMEHSRSFDEDSVRLAPVRVETFHGFVFVCVSPDAPSLLESLGDLPERLPEWFGPSGAARDCVAAGRREYVVDCNWKFLMENTCETYHTSCVHKSSLGPMKADPMPPHRGNWDAVLVPSKRTIVPLPDDFRGPVTQVAAGGGAAAGGEHNDDGEVDFDAMDTREWLHPLPTFAKRTAFVNLFPALQINVTFDCFWWMALTPLGPERTRIVQGFCFPKSTVVLPQFPDVFEKCVLRQLFVDREGQRACVRACDLPLPPK